MIVCLRPLALLKLVSLVLVAMGLQTGIAGNLEAERKDDTGPGGISWIRELETGLEAAGQTGRPVLVYFHAEWCSWCQVFERDILGHPDVGRFIARSYVPVLVNYDARPELFRRLGGRGLPYTVILSPDGHVLARLPGILGVADLVATLKDVLAGRHWLPAPVGDALVHVERLDTDAYLGFRKAWLDHLDRLYDPGTGDFTGVLESGVGIKRPAPLAWIYLTERGLWAERTRLAAHMARARLYDEVDGGWFYFRDPHRDEEHLETAKLLDVNFWMAGWMAAAGKEYDDRILTRTAELTIDYLRRVLWDANSGGFWQAQVADQAYYLADPGERRNRRMPPVDRIKRTDSNAQAAWALVWLADLLDDDRLRELAAATLDHLLDTQLLGDRLYHAWQDGKGPVAAFNLPRDMFWVLAAGDRVQRVRFDAHRSRRLELVLQLAVDWLQWHMREGAATRLPADLAGLVAWVTVTTQKDKWPRDATRWALRGLRIGTDTMPQEPVLGLMAWEALLVQSSNSPIKAQTDPHIAPGRNGWIRNSCGNKVQNQFLAASARAWLVSPVP